MIGRRAWERLRGNAFRRSIAVTYGSQGATILGSLAFMAIVTRGGGIAVYGGVAVLLALGSTFSNLLSSRTNEAVTTFVKQAEVSGNPGRASVAKSTGFAFDLVVATLTFTGFAYFAEWIATDLVKLQDSTPAILAFAGSVCSNTIRGTAQGVLIARGRFGALSALTCCEQVLKVGLVAAAWRSSGAISLLDAATALLASSSLATLVALALLLSDGGLRRTACADPGRIRWEFLRYSFNTFISTTLKAGHKNLDTIVVGRFTDPATAGVYATIRQSLAPLAFLAAPFSTVSAPQFVAHATVGRSDETLASITRINRRMTLVMAALVVLSAIGLAAYAHVQGFGLGVRGWGCFAMMAASAWLVNALWWTRPFSLAYDPGLSIRANLLALGVMLAAVIPLTARWDVLGAAAGSLSISLSLFIYWRSARATYARRNAL